MESALRISWGADSLVTPCFPFGFSQINWQITHLFVSLASPKILPFGFSQINLVNHSLIRIFARKTFLEVMQENLTPPPMPRFSETVIVMDANYVDSVAYDFIANLENDLKRRVPDCDLCTFLLCNALDGGVTEGNKEVQVVMVCRKGETQMGHLVPHNLRQEVDGFAFNDSHLGEFQMMVVEEEEEDIMAGESLYVQVTRVALSSRDIKRLILVADWTEMKDDVCDEIEDAQEACEQANESLGKEIVVITTGRDLEVPAGCRAVQMGYAMLHCLGVTEEELNK